MFTEFQYIDEVINANRFLGPGILLVYFAFVNLILVSMLIAVVEEAFTRAQEDLRTTSETDKLFNSFKNNLISFRRKLGQAGTVRKKIGTCWWSSPGMLLLQQRCGLFYCANENVCLVLVLYC